MHFDLPDCKRCCFCIPLRHGILVFGYLNLFFSILFVSLELWQDLAYGNTHTMFLYRGVGMYTHLWFTYLLFALEIIFNTVLLIGAHKKNTRLIRAYYYYGIVTTLAVFLTFIVIRRYDQLSEEWFIYPFEFGLAFSGLVIECYLLLLIRTELNKLKYLGGQFRYVNHMAEAAGDAPQGEGETTNSTNVF